MDEDFTILRHLIDRPELYIGVRQGSALLAFMAGYQFALYMKGQPLDEWEKVFEKVRRALDPILSPENSHTLGMTLRRISGGDEAKAFDLLAEETRKALPPERPSAKP